MKRLLVLLLAFGCGSSAPRPAAPAASSALPRRSDDAIIDEMLTRLGAVAKCPGSRRAWCVPAGGWAQGEAPDLPEGDRALPGVTIGLEREREDADLLATEVV